jgi:hypothetical protein
MLDDLTARLQIRFRLNRLSESQGKERNTTRNGRVNLRCNISPLALPVQTIEYD